MGVDAGSSSAVADDDGDMSNAGSECMGDGVAGAVDGMISNCASIVESINS